MADNDGIGIGEFRDPGKRAWNWRRSLHLQNGLFDYENWRICSSRRKWDGASLTLEQHHVTPHIHANTAYLG